MGPEEDRWMERWLPTLRASAGERPVLELGCDAGGDTTWLLQQGFSVIAADISAQALRACAAAAPAAQLLQLDLRQSLPFADASFKVVIASLCLHYFDWRTTVAAVQQIHRCLQSDGLLLCRVNSLRDVHHGATGFAQIERHYFRIDARYANAKRFFDGVDLDRLFANGWSEMSRQELTIHRYDAPKVAWELVLHRS